MGLDCKIPPMSIESQVRLRFRSIRVSKNQNNKNTENVLGTFANHYIIQAYRQQVQYYYADLVYHNHRV